MSGMRLAELSLPQKRELLRRLLADRPARRPLSCGQKALFFLAQLEATGAAYNLAFAARVRGQIDPAALRRSLAALVERHDTLRTTFTAEGGLPYQVVHPRGTAHLALEDAAHTDLDELRRHCAALAQAPFDLERGPLLRAHLFTRGPREAVLLLAAHHLIGDFWSLVVLLEELGRLYRAEVEGQPLALPPPAADYGDFVRWQRELLAGEAGERLEAYWRDQLAGALAPLDLPTDRPRPAVQTHAAASHSFRVAAPLAAGLKRLAQAEDATLFMVLVAAWQALLQRHSGASEFVVGAPVAGRERPEFRDVVGFFVNMVPLRASLGDDPTWRVLLGRVRRTVLGALEHQAYPFARLVERLAPPRDAARAPLLQATLVLQKRQASAHEARPLSALTQAGAPLDLGGLRLESLGLDSGATQFDLTLFAEEDDDGTLLSSLVYNRDLFTPSRIEALSARLLRLLQSALTAPEARLSELELLAEGERARLEAWSRGPASRAPHVPVHERICAQARRTPDAIAVRAAQAVLTYADLERRARRVAHALRAAGLSRDGVAGLYLARSPELVVGLLAVLKAGGAYLPLDPQAPAERNAFIAADVGLDLVLTSAASGPPPPGPRRVLRVEDCWARGEESELPPRSTPDSLAYVLYTSGSTGRPKGVMVPHAALGNHMDWMARRFPLGAHERVLQRTPPGFDASVWEFFAPLHQGAELVLAPPDALDAARLAGLIAAQRVTTLQVVPSLLRWLLEEDEFQACDSLRRVFCGGESLPPALSRRFRQRSRAELVNLYGPTEACIDATAWVVEGASGVRIGRPIDGLECHVLDGHARPQPPGVAGELYVGGAGLARGYVGRPALTAERFVPHPSPRVSGERLYRTGDRAVWHADGTLEYLGRLDRQVKLHGFRVEPQEIEQRLGDHPDVRQAVVTCLAHDGTQRLVAYVVPHGGRRADPDELRRFLLPRLPASLVPTLWVPLARLPVTSSGKVDYAALPAPAPAQAQAADAPRTPLEATLAEIWADVLGLAAVGVHDDFFALGGDSLLSLQVAARARRADLALPLETLLRCPTVAELAAAIARDSSAPPPAGPAAPLVLLQPVGAAPPLFCVHGAEAAAHSFAALARLLGEERPVYGLEAPELRDPSLELRPTSIEELAARYGTAVRTAQPHGPYHLLGWSMGAAVAYEMARQWQIAGEPVAFLGLLDQGARPHDWSHDGGGDGDGPGSPPWLAVRDGIDDLQAALARGDLTQLLRQPRLADWLRTHPDPARARRMAALVLRHEQALRAYTPPASPLAVRLFRAEGTGPRATTDPTLGWNGLARGGVEVAVVPGGHFSVLRVPHVRTLARVLDAALRQAAAWPAAVAP